MPGHPAGSAEQDERDRAADPGEPAEMEAIDLRELRKCVDVGAAETIRLDLRAMVGDDHDGVVLLRLWLKHPRELLLQLLLHYLGLTDQEPVAGTLNNRQGPGIRTTMPQPEERDQRRARDNLGQGLASWQGMTVGERRTSTSPVQAT